ncbi:hypothetical protein P0F65_20080 [Sphingomonas sp. I4]
MAKATFGPWQVAAGAFRSRFARDEYHTAFYRGVDASGVGRSFVLAGRTRRPPRPRASCGSVA